MSLPATHRPSFVLVAGYAGVGKSEFADLLSRETGWPRFDKDVVTKSFVERLLRSLGADVDDRHSDLYQKYVRDREYQSFMEFGFAQLACGSVILDAPFIREARDSLWLSDLETRCAELAARAVIIWVHCAPETMRDRIQSRGASRDTWKLVHWADYMSTVDFSLPDCAHFFVSNDSTLGSSLPSSLGFQACEIAKALEEGS